MINGTESHHGHCTAPTARHSPSRTQHCGPVRLKPPLLNRSLNVDDLERGRGPIPVPGPHLQGYGGQELFRI